MNRVSKSFRVIISLIMALALLFSGFGGLSKSYISEVNAEGEKTITVNALAMYDYAYEVLDLVNTERKNAGLSELEMDTELLSAAMQRAAESAVSFSHTRPNGNMCFTVSEKMMGENIAAGQMSPTDVVNAWMNSAGHKENILGSTYKSIGIGAVYINGDYYYYWSQAFGTTDATVPAKRTDQTAYNFSVEVSSTLYTSLTSSGYISNDTYYYTSGTDGSDVLESFDGGSGQWKQDANGWYFLLDNGTYPTGCVGQIDDDMYIFDENGYILIGWQEFYEGWVYLDSNGVWQKDTWVDGYYIDEDGICSNDYYASWYVDSNGWYFQDKNGWYPSNEWVKIDGAWYYFNSSGYMGYSEWRNGCWLDASGAWNYEYIGDWSLDSNGWKFSDTSGWHPSNEWLYIDGAWYEFDINGYSK